MKFIFRTRINLLVCTFFRAVAFVGATALLPAAALAQETSGQATHWVVASYLQRSLAITEGERISAETGVEVLMLPVEVDGDANYQLLVRIVADAYDQARLRSQLKSSGVTQFHDSSISGNEPEIVSLFAVLDDSGGVMGATQNFAVSDDPLPADPPSENVDTDLDLLSDSVSAGAADRVARRYLVVGSYRNGRHAQNLMTRLHESFDHVFAIVADVRGVDHYRVLIGPVAKFDEAELQTRISIEGIDSAWYIPGTNLEQNQLSESALIETLPSPSEESIESLLGIPEEAAEEAIEEDAEQVVPDDAQPVDDEPQYTSTRSPQLDSSLETDAFNLAKLKKSSSPFFLADKI